MATKLTPETLRRLVLEEKAKVEKKYELDKGAKKALHMEMDEESWDKAPLAKKKTFKPGDKPTLEEMRVLREQEEILRNRLRKIQERRTALRRKIISSLD